MANSDRVYLVVPQEPCHTGVMGTFGPLVVQRSPGNGELLPVADLLVGHVGDRDPVGSSPARVDLAIICDWHAYPHVESLLAGARKFWAPLGSPVLDQTRRDSLLWASGLTTHPVGGMTGCAVEAVTVGHADGRDLVESHCPRRSRRCCAT